MGKFKFEDNGIDPSHKFMTAGYDQRELELNHRLRWRLMLNPQVEMEISPQVEMEISPKVEMQINPQVEMEIIQQVEMQFNPQVEMEINA